jgi:hypothetical protein
MILVQAFQNPEWDVWGRGARKTISKTRRARYQMLSLKI